MKNISLIGCTGSIGRQVLKVAQNHSDEFRIVALVAGHDGETFREQVKTFSPVFSAVAADGEDIALKAAELDCADIVFNAASGFAGLSYSIKAIERGRTLALANKETLVCGGEYVTKLARRNGVTIIPVDSEHSALWQCLGFGERQFRSLIITASGGAFRGKRFEELEGMTAAQALCHPTWQMGAKITVDSATLLNKGYEVIEAHHLFGAAYSDIKTVIQPQSIVHSLVEFCDGACIAQLGAPTMEVPIQLALTYPERLETAVKKLDFDTCFSLDFEKLDREMYPLYDLALTCGERGGTLPCALNAADETAVHAFLRGKIGFNDIFRTVAAVVGEEKREEITSFSQLKAVDARARRRAEEIISKRSA